jgi:hypothetical protein
LQHRTSRFIVLSDPVPVDLARLMYAFGFALRLIPTPATPLLMLLPDELDLIMPHCSGTRTTSQLVKKLERLSVPLGMIYAEFQFGRLYRWARQRRSSTVVKVNTHDNRYPREKVSNSIDRRTTELSHSGSAFKSLARPFSAAPSGHSADTRSFHPSTFQVAFPSSHTD